MALGEALAWTARAVVEVPRIMFVGFPKEHIGRLKRGVLERLTHDSGGPIKRAASINDDPIHQVTCKLDIALLPRRRVGPMQWTHENLPTLHDRVEQPMLWAEVSARALVGERFARFVEPPGRLLGIQ